MQIAQITRQKYYFTNSGMILKIWDHRCDRLVKLSKIDIQKILIWRPDLSKISEEAGETRNLSDTVDEQ